jgi:hypothetical protein
LGDLSALKLLANPQLRYQSQNPTLIFAFNLCQSGSYMLLRRFLLQALELLPKFKSDCVVLTITTT